MSISWNEIKTRAAAFVIGWKEKAPTAREEADAQTFENEFFNIFGIDRSKVAIFEQKVKLDEEGKGYIDLFWKGHIIVEMKSPGKDMAKAYVQAKDYANALRPSDLPRAILVCDFNRFHYYDLQDDAALHEFLLEELVQHVELFSDLAGYRDIEYKEQDAVNVEAAERMGRLHDRLKAVGYLGHQLEVYLVRLLFCLFADDTGIFEHDSFIKYILQRTNPDGSDLGLHLAKIFELLDKESGKRSSTLDQQLSGFPYVNGGLFEERLEAADFDSKMRESLIECCALDWSKISPAIFGAMFQSVMNADERRNLGAHYTSEENIQKLIRPLFLDELWAEFDKLKALKSEVRVARLNEFHDRLAALKFLDPACGCGNFLVITYRELRILELEVIKELLGGARLLDVDHYIKVNVDQFYGIEIEEFPSQIAEVAMWLMDHQMNMLVRDKFGEYYIRIPLRKSATILCANALTTDWESVVPKAELSYILGNPPFVGFKFQSEAQKKDMQNIFKNECNTALLDYVTCWYLKAADYMLDTDIETAFVSTNSICQGTQVGQLWSLLISKYDIKINFAHQTFKWSNDARGNAAVFCVIIGFGLIERKVKKLFVYASNGGDPVEKKAMRINAYLIDAENIWIFSRSKPLCNVPNMIMGNQAMDGGNLIIEQSDYDGFISQEPLAKKWIRNYVMGSEFINGKVRYCLWLKDCPPQELKKMPLVVGRIEKVRQMRAASKDKGAQRMSKTPSLFRESRNPHIFVAIPIVSSERRDYVPMGYLGKETIAGNKIFIVENASLYHFGILNSTMHMAWMRYICGRLKSDYTYSKEIVYNNFPWPEPSDKQRADIEAAAQAVLDARLLYPDSNLADLYDPNLMPPELSKAHQKLDRLVEKAYGKSFDSDAERVAFLFERYQKLTGDLFTETGKKRKPKQGTKG